MPPHLRYWPQIQWLTPVTSPFATPASTRIPSPPPPQIAQMPLELVIYIMETVCNETLRDPERTQFLLSCSLVCRSWSMVAQRMLFSRVSIRSQPAFEAFIKAVDCSTIHSRRLRDAVTSMSIILDNSQPLSLHQHGFALAVSVCPNLRHLRLALYGRPDPRGSNDLRLRRPAPPFDEQTLTLLRAGPPITSLQFDNWSDNHTALFQILSIWPTLDKLAICGLTPQVPLDAPLPFQCRLSSIRLNFQIHPPTSFIQWLLHNSTGHLHSMYLDRDPSMEVLEHLLLNHHAHLQHLALPSVPAPPPLSTSTSSTPSSGESCLHLLSRCGALRSLRTETPISYPSFYKNLPHTLTQLAIAVDKDTPLKPLVLFLNTHRNLEALAILLWGGGHLNLGLASVKIACAYRGVKLRITMDAYVHRLGHAIGRGRS